MERTVEGAAPAPPEGRGMEHGAEDAASSAMPSSGAREGDMERTVEGAAPAPPEGRGMEHRAEDAASSATPPSGAREKDVEHTVEDTAASALPSFEPWGRQRAAEGGAAGETDEAASLDDRIVAALREVYDPEIPVNIYDLGLIYRIDRDDLGVVEIDMTLTAPGCPVAQTFPGVVEAAVQNVEGVATAEVELVWEPPWTPDRMSESAKLELGFF